MTTEPLPVSVVIPAYNRRAEIVRAVEGVLAQRPRPPAEVIVVDDASTDGTADAAAALGVKVIRLSSNGGAARARRAGIESASSPWIGFCDSDDEWLPWMLSTLWAEHRPELALIAGAAIRQGAGPLAGRYHGTVSRQPELVDAPARVLFPENPIPMSAALVRRDALLAVGAFDEPIRYSEDFAVWLRLFERHAGILVPQVVTVYHVHEGQKSNSRVPLRRAQDQIVEGCRSRAWWTAKSARRRSAVVAWDDLQAARHGGDHREALTLGLDLLTHPGRLAALLAVWKFRMQIRRRSAHWTPAGELTEGEIPAARGPGGLSASGLLALTRYARRPPASVRVHSAVQARLVAAVGSTPVWAGDHATSTRPQYE